MRVWDRMKGNPFGRLPSHVGSMYNENSWSRMDRVVSVREYFCTMMMVYVPMTVIKLL